MMKERETNSKLRSFLQSCEPLRVGCRTAERLQQKEINFQANVVNFMIFPMARTNWHPNFLIHLKYILRDKLAAPETLQLIFKGLLAFCLRMNRHHSLKVSNY